MSEHLEQVAVFDLIRANEAKYPFLKWIFAVPNGGSRHPAVAGKLKAEGVRRGISDIVIPIPMRDGPKISFGAFCELKVGKNKCTPEQTEFLAFVAAKGYTTGVCYGADEAIQFIEKYLGVKLQK
jgi:hypothetical protein